VNRFFKIFLIVVLSVFSTLNLSANDTFFSTENFRYEKTAIDADMIDAWEMLLRNGRTTLKTDVEALTSLNTLLNNSKLASKLPGKTTVEIENLLAKMNGCSEASYKQVCDKVNLLIDELPTNVTGLDKYLGSAGFGNANMYTNRHSWVQLERLLANKSKLNIADEIVFERHIQNIVNGTTYTSFTDVYIRIGSDIYEIETKAGIKFFENVTNNSSNFTKQSFNSLTNVNKLENYKVFLNPTILAQLDNAATLATKKNNVITAWKNWEGGVLYELDEVKPLFETFATSKGFDFETGTIDDISNPIYDFIKAE